MATTMTIGKNRGLTFDEVIANDIGYVSWLTSQKQQNLLDNPNLIALLEYAESKGVDIPPYVFQKPKHPLSGDQKITKGAHKGKTFDFMIENHGDYILWLRERLRKGEPTSMEFRQLCDYASA